MRRAAALVVAVLAVLAAPAPAAAESVFVPLPRLGAPSDVQLTGDALVWIELQGYGHLRVVKADLSTGRTRTLAQYGERENGIVEWLAFDASASLLAVNAVFDEGSVQVLGRHDDLRPSDRSWWDIDGGRVLEPLDIDTLRVHEHVSGESTTVALPPDRFGTQSAFLAGDLIGYWRESTGRVFNWRTGEELLRHDWPSGWIAGLQPDGTALWGRNAGAGAEYRVSIGGQLGGPLPIPGRRIAQLGADRVAYDDDDRDAIVVLDLAGREVAAAPLPAITNPLEATDHRLFHGVDEPATRLADFDGRRAVFNYTACVGAVVAVWDVDAGPLDAPRRCHASRLAGPVRAARGTTRVPLRCPAAHVTGCPTDVTVRTRGRARTVRHELLPGRKGAARVPVAPGRRATIVLRPGFRAAPGERRTHRVRLRG